MLDPHAIHPTTQIALNSIAGRMQALELRRMELHAEEASALEIHQVEVDMELADFMLQLVLDYLSTRGALDEAL